MTRWAAFTDDEIWMILGWDSALDQEFRCFGDPPKKHQQFLDEMHAELERREALEADPVVVDL